MARPREFDEDNAIDGAMQAFWRHGYGATKLPDLLSAMSLTRGSFYKAFGDKRSVYLEALRRYDAVHIGGAVAILGDQSIGDSKARLLALFDGSFDGLKTGAERRGCLMCNAMVELGPSDPEVAQLTASMCARVYQAILDALASDRPAQARDLETLRHRATIVTNLYFGAQALSKSGQDMPDWGELLTAITRIDG